MGIGKRIKEARQRAGLTQKELSRIVGVTPSAITNYENEVSHPKEPVLYALMQALEVDANFFFQDEVAPAQDAALSSAESEHIRKYRALSNGGRRVVDTVLDREYDRMRAQPVITLPFFQDRVSAGIGNFVSNGTTEQLSIKLLPETSGSDYVVQVTGDSMMPAYHDGDLVLVHSQPEVAVGEIGLWIVNGDGYIKQRGENSLRSLNPLYAPIRIEDGDRVDCFGKVLRRLEAEWVV